MSARHQKAAEVIGNDLKQYRKCMSIAERLQAELTQCCVAEFGLTVHLRVTDPFPLLIVDEDGHAHDTSGKAAAQVAG